MRRLILGSVAIVLTSLGLVMGVGTLTPAFAECERVSSQGICLDDIDTPPPPPPTDGGGSGDSSTPTGGVCTGAPGGRCVDAAGHYWNAAHGCYAVVQDPQPGPDSPVWAQNNITAADGQFYWCMTGPNTGAVWFVENGEAPVVVDAEGIARRMVARAPFEVADLAMAPPWDHYTYIRIENWLWVPEGQWHDVSVSENVGPATVTLTATPTRLEVDAGNGAPATNCYDPGRPWVKGMTDAAKTTCSFVYESIDDPKGSTYNVVGRLYYEVSWTCTGACSAPAGDLGEYAAPDSPTHPVEVRQRQTVVTG